MKIKIWLASLLLSVITPIFIATPSAVAGCRDYPESITPGCVAQNLAEEQARQVADQAKRAQDLIDAENRAKEQAAQEFVANGSRPCSVYPASITAACAAENLGVEQEKQKSAIDKQAQALLDAEEKAKENAEKDYIANGSRPCTLYPASITAACAAENLEYETKKQIAAAAKFEADQIEAEQKALKQAKDDYIRNGSRPCSVFPASTTPECAAANLKYEEIKKVEIAALAAARETSTKALITTKDENGSLLVAGNVPKGVDLLNTKIRLLNSKGKLVDTGEIRYDSAGKPYFVFDKQVGKGNYKIELSIPKKKAATISVKL
jgi:coenzyme F420-reducing hydrogenase alpha subunit